MTDRKISLGQWMTVLFLTLFPLGTEGLPDRLWEVGAAAWVCPLLAGAVAVGAAAILTRRPVLGQGDLAGGILRRWGGKVGRSLTALFFLWGLVLTTAHAARIGGRLSDSLRASPVLITAVVLLLAGWLAAGGVPAFARTCEIFALAVGFGFLLIFLFGVFRLDWENVLLWNWGELARVPQGTLSAGGVLAVGAYALFLLGDVRAETASRRWALTRLSSIFLLLAAAMVLVLGRLGAALAAQIDRPFFQMVSGLGFEGAFQRLEELVSALWVLGDLALLGVLLLSLRRLLAVTLQRQESRAPGWIVPAVAFLGSIHVSLWNRVLAGPLLPAGSLAALVLLLCCLAGVKKGHAKKSEKIEKRD